MKKRVFLIVLDSFGVGELPDAADFSDEGSKVNPYSNAIFLTGRSVRRVNFANPISFLFATMKLT